MFTTISLFFLSIAIIVTANDDIIFSVNDIVCTDGFHEYNGYYSSPCYKWKTEIQRYHSNTVRCTIVQNNLGETIIGCTPGFGTYDDRFIVDYEVTKLKNNQSCSNVQYTATALATHYGVLHPIANIIVTILVLAFLVYYQSYYSYPFMGVYLGSRIGSYRYRYTYNSGRTSWSRMR
jgi:hypothetical protein